MKKFLLVLIALGTTFSLTGCFGENTDISKEEQVNNREEVKDLQSKLESDKVFIYEYDEENNDVVIKGLKEGAVLTETLEIGATFEVDGKKFYTKTIADEAFYTENAEALYSGDVKKLVLNEGIETIGDMAFSKGFNYDVSQVGDVVSVKELVMPSTIKTIGKKAFFMNGISKLVLNEGLIDIGDQAFMANTILELDIPSTLQTIGVESFSGNSILDLNLSGSIDIISEKAFANNRIVDLEIPRGIKVISEGAFLDNRLKTLKLNDDLEEIGEIAFSFGGFTQTNVIEELVLPEGIKKIGTAAFLGNSISEIVVPSSVTELGNMSFYMDTLTKITFEGEYSDELLKCVTWEFIIENLEVYDIDGKIL